MSGKYLYFVEGECEKALLKAFMHFDMFGFIPGKVEVLNFVNKKLTNAQARMIKKDTKVVIIFDTDSFNIQILDENIKTLIEIGEVKANNLVIVMSVKTFEDELVYSCNKITNINDLLNTNGISEFKKKFIKHSDLPSKLLGVGFNINLMWSRKAYNPFDKYINSGNRIKRINSKYVKRGS